MDDDQQGTTSIEHGLTAFELGQVAVALDALLTGAVIEGASLIEGRDDLLLFVETPEQRHTLQIAPGGKRARITVTNRRFAKDELDSSPRAHHVASVLCSNSIDAIDAVPDRRCAKIRLRGPAPARFLHIELFGARGLWAICDSDNRILALSRLPTEAARTLRPGDAWLESLPLPPRAEPAPRFPAPILHNVDAAFCAFDARLADTEARTLLLRGIERVRKRQRDRLAGLDAQQLSIAGAADLRARADLLLAYGGTLAHGAPELRVRDPMDESREIVIEREPSLPYHEQARRMYDRARRLDAARDIAAGHRAEALAELEAVDELAARMQAAIAEDAPEVLDHVHAELARRGVVPRPRRQDGRKREEVRKLAKITRGENFRRFKSTEGHLILVGRDNAQNDRLSIKVARGNDLWLHVGRGYAGSHVVVRLEKGKQASLETLLDAGTLAIHFSKVRGTDAEEVIYTQARHVKKPKGLPPGKVLAHHHKSIKVRIDEERLRRLLSSSTNDESA